MYQHREEEIRRKILMEVACALIVRHTASSFSMLRPYGVKVRLLTETSLDTQSVHYYVLPLVIYFLYYHFS